MKQLQQTRCSSSSRSYLRPLLAALVCAGALSGSLLAHDETTLTLSQYLARVVVPARIERGRREIAEHAIKDQ